MPDPAPASPRRAWHPLYTWTASLVAASAAWYLLKELGPLIRPPVFAVLLAYAFLPIYAWLRQRLSTPLSITLIALAAIALCLSLGLQIYRNLVELNVELPGLIAKAQTLYQQLRDSWRQRLPEWLTVNSPVADATPIDSGARVQRLAGLLLNASAGFLGELLLILFYLVFMLLEVRKLPTRARSSFSPEKAQQLESIAGSISESMVHYLRAKVISSLILAVPATLIFWFFGVRFAVMWGLLTFIGNFIPYIGSLVALLPPIALAFLELDPLWKPVILVGLLSLNQFVATNLIEPLLTSRAVNLSPLIVLFALTFWGLCWGIPGMILAIPLTVMLKIIWENIPLTRPLARLMSGE